MQGVSMMRESKKGMSGLQIHRQIGSGDYRNAWYMCQRIRAAMTYPDMKALLGDVEVDETYIGGKAHNRHGGKNKMPIGHGTAGKLPVIGAIARKGNVVCKMIENTDTKTLGSIRAPHGG